MSELTEFEVRERIPAFAFAIAVAASALMFVILNRVLKFKFKSTYRS